MKPSIDTRFYSVSRLVCRLALLLFSIVVGVSTFSDRTSRVSSVSPQEQASARFESALRQQRQSARFLTRNQNVEGKFQKLSARVVETGVIPVIATLRVAYSPQLEVRGEVESMAQQYEIGRVREVVIDDLIGYDPASIKRYNQLPIVGIKINATGIESLRQSDNIIDIQEDKLNRMSLAESVPFIGGTNAWASGFTGAGQTVAILDTGVDKNHPMLAGKVVSEACYSSNYSQYSAVSLCPGGATSSTATNSALPCPSGCQHGTHVAGIAAGKTVTNSGITFSGVAKDASIIAIQVFTRINDASSCGGSAPCYAAFDSDIIGGLNRVYSLRNTYSISSANLSLGGGSSTSYCDGSDAATKTVIDLLRSANIATVIASGNESLTDSISSPACISTAVSVGATLDTANIVASYSNSASFLSLLAPGSGITSAVPGTSYGRWNGTSMATPHVTGAWAIAKQKAPTASVTTVLNAFKSTGVSVVDSRNGIAKPRIAVDLAIAQLSGTPPTPTAPAAPTTLVATTFSSTQINLSWVDSSSNETGFVLQRKTGTAGTWATINSPAANVTTYQDRAVAASTAYYYRIYATNSVGQSAASNEATATTSGPTAAPTGVTATAFSSTQVNLRWTDVATNETGYRIERRLASGTALSLVANLAAGVTTYSNTGLTPGTGYIYVVSAIAPGGVLSSAAGVPITTFASTATPTLISAIAISSSQVNLSWRDNATNETGYRIERRLTSGTTLSLVANLAANATSYQNTGLTAATGYTYVVSAIAPGGGLVSATPIAVTTYALTAAPTSFTATAFSASQVNLSWRDAATNETGYRIERRLTSGTTLSLVANLPANAASYQNTGLTAATGYTYVVSAIAPGGALASSAPVVVTTYALTAAPTTVVATPFSSNQINLTWRDMATNETGYRIQRRLTTGTAWTILANLAANATSYRDTGLATSTGYTYLVSAIAPGGALVSAAQVATATFATTSAPTNFTATAVSATQINLSWSDVATNETGYRILRRQNSGTAWTVVALLPANYTSYRHTGLVAATGYTFIVSAVAPGGTLVNSSSVGATTLR